MLEIGGPLVDIRTLVRYNLHESVATIHFFHGSSWQRFLTCLTQVVVGYSGCDIASPVCDVSRCLIHVVSSRSFKVILSFNYSRCDTTPLLSVSRLPTSHQFQLSTAHYQ